MPGPTVKAVPPAEEPLPRHRIALVAAAVLWSTGGLFIKTLTANPGWHSSALGITYYRSLFAFLCLLPLARGRRPPAFRDAAAAIVIYLLLLATYIAATQGTTAANAIFLQYTAPVYALVLGPLFFRERFVRADGWSLLLAMVGIGILFFGSFHGGERGPLLLGLSSGLMFGLFLLWLRHMRYADPIAVTVVNNGGVALLAALALLFGPPGNHAGFVFSRQELALPLRTLAGAPGAARALTILVLMGVFQIAAPYVLFSYGLTRVPSVEGSLLALVEPVLNPVWVGLFIGERPSAATVAGGALILLALAGRYTLFRSSPRRHGDTEKMQALDGVKDG